MIALPPALRSTIDPRDHMRAYQSATKTVLGILEGRSFRWRMWWIDDARRRLFRIEPVVTNYHTWDGIDERAPEPVQLGQVERELAEHAAAHRTPVYGGGS